jgi:hypothetical protein
MKRLALVMFLGAALFVKAEDSQPPDEPKNYLTNGDFSDDLAHWSGVHAPEDNPDGSRGQGARLKFSPSEWTIATHDVDLPAGAFKLHVAFTFPAAVNFSVNIPDYIGLKQIIGIPTENYVEAHPGEWLVVLADETDNHSLLWRVTPTAKVGPQSYTFTLAGFNAANRQTLKLAFPPGSGSVVLNRVTIVTAASDAAK